MIFVNFFSLHFNMKTLKFRCNDCNKRFSTKFEFVEHKNIHSGDFPFMCGVCEKLFASVSEYVNHSQSCHVGMKNTSPKPMRAQCQPAENTCEELDETEDTCGSFKLQLTEAEACVIEEGGESKQKRKHGLRNEIDKQTDQEESCKKYFCNKCNMNFNSVKKYNKHNNELHVFLCENCNNKYSSSEKLDKHVCFVLSGGEPFKCSCSLTFTKASQFKLHVGSRPYSCCRCSMQFNRVTNLIRHIRTHTKQKPYVCKQCGRGFSQSTNLKNHTSVHLGVKAIQCDDCDFSCKTVSGLIKHKKKHIDGYLKHSFYIDKRKTSTEAVICPICKKEFPFKRNMGMHMKIHKRKESLCQECGKVFDSKGKLTTHYKACHGVPSICQTCGKTFASSVLLSAHEKIHVLGKKFSCTKCCKMFSIRSYLIQHMKTHSEGKQYSCNKCGKLFKVAVSLKYHSKICAG